MAYQNQVKVGYTDCDMNNRLKLSAAMRLMQQCSSEHLETLELPAERLFQANMVFLLTKMCIKVHRMPLCREEVLVRTAPIAIKGVRFIREFRIDAPDGERLLSAVSLWVLVDPHSHKVLRPASFPWPLPIQDSFVEGAVEDLALPRLGGEEEVRVTEIPIRYSHLDVNRHVNNCFYGDFVLDALPYEQVSGQALDTVVIHFQHEAVHGETLRIGAAALDENSYLLGGEHGRGTCFEALVALRPD